MKKFILGIFICISSFTQAQVFRIYIQFDEFPEDISYEIYDASATTLLFSSFDFDPEIWAGKLKWDEFDFGMNCHVIRFYDDYGDGLCCAYGNGFYYIQDADGNRIETRSGDFGFFDEFSFCLDGGNTTEEDFSCTDGIMNGSETGIDCGGVDCIPCVVGMQAKVQRSFTHTNISRYGASVFSTATSKIESDLKGERIIWSTYDPVFTGSRKVYTATTDGSEMYEIFDFISAGPLFAPPMVDISADGSKILFTVGEDKIYISNFNGSGRYVIVDEIQSPTNPNDRFEPELRSAPQFSGSLASPLNIYFIHTDFGPNGTGQAAERAGLYFAAVNGSTVLPTRIFSAKNVAELYGAAANSYTPMNGLFGPKVSEGNLILFGTRDYSNSGGAHLWTNLNTTFNKITENGPSAGDINAIDISGDGNTVVWHDVQNDRYSIKTIDPNNVKNYPRFAQFGQFGAHFLSTNFYGNRTLIQGPGEDNCVIITASGQKHFPLHISKYSDSFNGVGSATISRSADRIIFRSSDALDNIFMTTFGVDGTVGDAHPKMEKFDFSKNWVLRGSGNSVFKITVKEASESLIGVNFVELNHGNSPISVLNNFSNHFLFNDGNTLGDEAVDNIFTHNNVREQSFTTPSVPDTFTVRINLFGDNYSSSYDIYPFYLLSSPPTSTIELPPTIDDIHLLPNPLFDKAILKINAQKTHHFNIDIYNHIGQKLKTTTSIKIGSGTNALPFDFSDLEPGVYILNISGKDMHYPLRFIKL